MNTGTLKELNVKPGDVIECVDNVKFHWWTVGKEYVVLDCGTPADNDGDTYEAFKNPQPAVVFRIVSRASEARADTPKLWRDMTPEEKGALLLAHHEGKVIEYCFCGDSDWQPIASPSFTPTHAYRVKPEPVVETVALCWKKGLAMGQIGTIDLVDGKPDCNSIKMEET